ncbi:MAG: NifU family protein [Alphaproteobacteria bacterium]
MFIHTESTPNPNSLKFIPGQDITGGAPINFTDKSQCKISPLAEKLFGIANVTAVFLGSDFITITKTESTNWDLLKPEILVTIMEYLVSKKPILKDQVQASNETSSAEEDDDLVKQIKELIETRVRPAVAQDGGDIIFKDFVDGIVKLELHGSCSGCPSSTVTLKDGIENMLKYYIPEIISVEAV